MKTKILAIAFVALAPFAASADDLSYNYAEVGYQFGGDVNVGPSLSTDGFDLRASFAVDDAWFVSFDYFSLSGDFGIDPKDYTLSAGYHGEMFYGKVGYEKLEIFGFSDSGYSLEGGARGMISDGFELNGHIGYADLGNWDTWTSYGFGAVYSFGDNMGVTFNYDLRSATGIDVTTYGLGFRMTFN